MDDYDKIVELKGLAIGGMAIHGWNRIIQVEKLGFDPGGVASYINEYGMCMPEMVEGISRIIGEPFVKDISCTICTVNDGDLEDNEVASLMIARVFPNNVHLIDVMYQNPYKPIPPTERRYMADHKGLGMLGPTLALIEDYAVSNACQFVTLTAAADHLAPLFEKYGFKLETNFLGKKARAMEKRVGPAPQDSASKSQGNKEQKDESNPVQNVGGGTAHKKGLPSSAIGGGKKGKTSDKVSEREAAKERKEDRKKKRQAAKKSKKKPKKK